MSVVGSRNDRIAGGVPDGAASRQSFGILLFKVVQRGPIAQTARYIVLAFTKPTPLQRIVRFVKHAMHLVPGPRLRAAAGVVHDGGFPIRT